jgi:hypothetical protein
MKRQIVELLVKGVRIVHEAGRGWVAIITYYFRPECVADIGVPVT